MVERSSMSWRWWVMLAGAGVVAAAAASFAADTLRLRAQGTTFVWAGLLAFGLAWTTRPAALWRCGAGLLFGGLAGIGTAVLALQYLPFTASGRAIGLGLGAALTLAVVAATRGRMPVGVTVAAFGGGIAASQLGGSELPIAADGVLAVASAFALASLIGLIAAELAGEVEIFAIRRSMRIAEPVIDEPVIDEARIDEAAPAADDVEAGEPADADTIVLVPARAARAAPRRAARSAPRSLVEHAERRAS